MLCKATVNLSDLPVDAIVDVDPDDETIKGLLRQHYIVPVVHQPMETSDKPPRSPGRSIKDNPQDE